MYMADRRSKEFIDGVHEFIETAEKNKYSGFILCPCKFCKNENHHQESSTVTCSIVVSCQTTMFGPSMKKEGLWWIYNNEEEDMIPDFAANYGAFFEDTVMGEPEEDAE